MIIEKTLSLKVFIVILNWNGVQDTIDCLSSIEHLTYPSIKTVVIDNASENNEAETISEKFPQVIVLKQKENLGFCGGCNVGIKYALKNNADYVMLLNNDTIVTPNLIENLLSGMDNLKDVGAISPLILEYSDTGKIWFSKAVWKSKIAQFKLSDNNDQLSILMQSDPYISEFACGCCLFAKSDVFSKYGLLDERYFAFYDEAEWCYRLKNQGLKSYVIPRATIFHKVSQSVPSSVSTYLLARNRLLWIRENLPLKIQIQSAPYLIKELLWHMMNFLMKKKKGYYTKTHSHSLMIGWKDYLLRRFYKWDTKTERVIFSKNENSDN